MPDENMQFPIPNSVLEPYIKAAVSTAITAALGDGTKLVAHAVQAALMTKVNGQGRISSSNYDNQYNLVDIVATNKIQEVAHEVINQMAEGMRPQITAEVEKMLRKQTSALAKMMVDSLIQNMSCSFNVSVNAR